MFGLFKKTIRLEEWEPVFSDDTYGEEPLKDPVFSDDFEDDLSFDDLLADEFDEIEAFESGHENHKATLNAIDNGYPYTDLSDGETWYPTDFEDLFED